MRVTRNDERIRRIVIRAANWVGDAVMSTPLIRAVRRNFPRAEVTVLAKPWVAPLFLHHPDVDRVMIYDAKGRHRGLAGILRLSRELRSGAGYDLAVLVQNAFEAALIARLAGIPRRLGYDTDGRAALLTHPVAMTPPIKRRHMIDYYLGIVEGAGLHSFGRRMTLEIAPEERRAAGRVLADMGLSGREELVGINPGAAFGTAKRWPAGRYAELCRLLGRSRPNRRFLVFGAPNERELGEDIAEGVGSGCVNLCGHTGLREAIALIERCRVFVTNDSGLMHVAAALDVPQVAIFGPTDHSTTYPASDRAMMAREPTPCAPCMKPHCPLGHHRCMTAISVERVAALVDGAR